jgi:hypothetical protein
MGQLRGFGGTGFEKFFGHGFPFFRLGLPGQGGCFRKRSGLDFENDRIRHYVDGGSLQEGWISAMYCSGIRPCAGIGRLGPVDKGKNIYRRNLKWHSGSIRVSHDFPDMGLAILTLTDGKEYIRRTVLF